MSKPIVQSEYHCEPYWWDDAPRPAPLDDPLPEEADVVVIGSGYTGLHVALQTARHGLSTLVLDRDVLGGGCSSRNGGQVSTSIKGSFGSLSQKYGQPQAKALLGEGVRALDFLDDFISDEQIDCEWGRCGHFTGAHNAKAYTRMGQELATLPGDLGIPWHMIPQSEQHQEIGTDRYHGGVVFPDHGALHPGRYHLGLLDRVQQAGALTLGGCAVERLEDPKSSGILVHTARGVVRAGKVVVATNGYTGRITPWQQRRIIPIGSYIIATDLIDEQQARDITPNNRTMTDTRKLVFYYRLCPERRRMLFGGRVALAETDPSKSAPALRAAMVDIFPQLAKVPITHSWLGFVGYTFDSLPHVGAQNGIHYAMGYCGSGISLASYCGMRLGQQLCGTKDAPSSLVQGRFPTRPLYYGNPWFLKPSILYYQLRDKLAV